MRTVIVQETIIAISFVDKLENASVMCFVAVSEKKDRMAVV